jgi:hypothetical protein
LWGIKSAPDWTSGERRITWNSAPANDGGSADALTKEAVLLARLAVPANPAPGATVAFSNHESVTKGLLVRFMNEAKTGRLTLAVTAKPSPAQRSGWRFAARENDKYDPPTLLLNEK